VAAFTHSLRDMQRLSRSPVKVGENEYPWCAQNGHFLFSAVVTRTYPDDDSEKIKEALSKLGKVKTFAKHINEKGPWTGEWAVMLSSPKPFETALAPIRFARGHPPMLVLPADQAIRCGQCYSYCHRDALDKCICRPAAIQTSNESNGGNPEADLSATTEPIMADEATMVTVANQPTATESRQDKLAVTADEANQAESNHPVVAETATKNMPPASTAGKSRPTGSAQANTTNTRSEEKLETAADNKDTKSNQAQGDNAKPRPATPTRMPEAQNGQNPRTPSPLAARQVTKRVREETTPTRLVTSITVPYELVSTAGRPSTSIEMSLPEMVMEIVDNLPENTMEIVIENPNLAMDVEDNQAEENATESQ
jgi:hypothetical protein